MEEKKKESIDKSIGRLEGLMTGVKDDVAEIKETLRTAIPGPLLIKIMTVFFLAIFAWLGTLTTIIMTK